MKKLTYQKYHIHKNGVYLHKRCQKKSKKNLNFVSKSSSYAINDIKNVVGGKLIFILESYCRFCMKNLIKISNDIDIKMIFDKNINTLINN